MYIYIYIELIVGSQCQPRGGYLFACRGRVACLWWQIIFISRDADIVHFPSIYGKKKLWTLIIAYFTGLSYMTAIPSPCGWSSVDWLMWPHNNHPQYSHSHSHSQSHSSCQFADFVYIYSGKSDFIQIAFCTWQKKSIENLYMCVGVWECLLYAYECVLRLTPLFPPLSNHCEEA